MPRPNKDALEQAKIDTKEILTTTHPMGDVSQVLTIESEIRRTCREIFKKKITLKDLHKPYAPSIRANYTNSRSEFGTLGTLFESGVMGSDVLSEESSIRQLYDSVIDYNNAEEMEEDELRYMKISPGFRKVVEERYSKIYEHVRVCALSEDADVELVALPESLKVRVISKGPALTYFVLKPVQKFLLKQMKKHRCFKLVGETVTDTFLESVFKGTLGQFHSLDYKSATDLLNPRMSAVAVEEICDAVGMPDDLRILFHKALTGHLVEGTPQVWGQLMGSIVSFIILCVINMAVIRYCYERSVDLLSGTFDHLNFFGVDEIPAVVNGDDGLVRASPVFNDLWQESALVAGLVPSIGKVYSHDTYANINSTSYTIVGDKFHLVKYVNMGLLMGLTRSGGKEGVVTRKGETNNDTNPFHKSLGARHHDLMKFCPFELRLAAHEAFLRHNLDSLKQAHVPWYIPEQLGGVGLMPLIDYSGDDFDSLTRSYSVTSTGHICGPNRLEVFASYGLIDRINKQFSVGKVPSLQPVQTRSIWQPSVSRLDAHGRRTKISESDASFLDLSTFYLAPSAVMNTIGSENRNERIHTNQRVWESLSRLHSDFSLSGDQLFLDF